jgi:radical SAM protein with 4Fe4S-binding SPASM domain
VSARRSLAVELTSACNQTCGHCYNAWREDGGREIGALSTEGLVAALERILANVELDHVTFTGGEPFSRRDLFELLEVCRAHGVRFQMISNAGLITDDLASRLAGYEPISIQVAVNAPDAALHDELAGGAGHFERTLRGLEALRRAGVRVVGCVVVTRKNAQCVGETLDLLASRGVREISFSRFSPAGFATGQLAELLPSRSEIVGALEAAEGRAIRHGLTLRSTMPIPPCVIDYDDYPHVSFGQCAIGSEVQELVLGPRGEIRHCTLHASTLGEVAAVDDHALDALLRSPGYRDVTPEFCTPCPHVAVCLGGCGAAAIAVSGARGLDPFVAQHVDPELSTRLARERASRGLVPSSALIRR